MIKVPELPEATDESEEPNLEWFVLKVQRSVTTKKRS
jgi:hypothetical protein